MKRRWVELGSAVLVAAALLGAGGGVAQAAARYYPMDAFKPSFQPLPGGAYARTYPFASGGRTPTATLNNYGGCATVRLPAGSVVNEIKYASEGTGGWSYAYLMEYRYGEFTYLRTDNVASYPTAGLEKYLLATSDTPISIRKGYRYSLCFEGAPAAASGSYNHFLGFRIRFRKP